jgi:hypothetical protein
VATRSTGNSAVSNVDARTEEADSDVRPVAGLIAKREAELWVLTIAGDDATRAIAVGAIKLAVAWGAKAWGCAATCVSKMSEANR